MIPPDLLPLCQLVTLIDRLNQVKIWQQNAKERLACLESIWLIIIS